MTQDQHVTITEPLHLPGNLYRLQHTIETALNNRSYAQALEQFKDTCDRATVLVRQGVANAEEQLFKRQMAP